MSSNIGLKTMAVSALALMASASYTATAQENGENSLTLGTITVTAQQRDEDLQDVPISVATLPDGLLDSMFANGEDILALGARVPGLYAESSNGRAAPRFYIRGLGNTDFDLAASQPVSVIMDDVVMENVALKSFPLFDVEQIEISRGPQGTLFGRNTTAGIIKISTARPTHEFGGYANATVGSYGTVNLEGAVGGSLIEDVLAVRVSALGQRREDWIDNTENPGSDDLGEFTELAGRVQLLYTPNDDFSALLNVRTRDLEGTSAIFRANVLTPGSNELNENFDRDRVSFDEGNDNQQGYNGWGSSATLEYNFGPVTLTSITGYESLNGFSGGDIDGGAGPYTFNFAGPFTYPELPFASATQDAIDELTQLTQEVRLASNSDGKLFWQAGVYYFDGAFTVTTKGIGGFPFPPASTLEHENTAWAVYGQTSYQVTDKFKLTGGLRYTSDEKDLTVFANAAQARNVSDEYLSWELSALYDITPDFSVYGRVADGFRGPSIQGRDVAFFADPSVADSETILSFEAGWKATLIDNRMRLNGAVYTYTVDGMQLTAVGGAGNSVQLINADEATATGFEMDVEYLPVENLLLTAGFSYTDTELKDSDLAVGTCAQCSVLDPLNANGFALVDGNPFPNAPETIANFTARYSIPFGDGEFFAFTDWAYQGETNIFLYESTEYQTDGQFEGGLKLGYAQDDGSWEFAVFARNITDEENIKGGIDFNNNTAFVNEPRIVGATLKTQF